MALIVEVNYQRDPATGQTLFDTNGNPQIIPDANANTYGQMQTRVANEVLGAITANDVNNAIQDAIQTYERQTFWFNDLRFFVPAGSGSSAILDGFGNPLLDGLGQPILAGSGGSTGLNTIQGKEFYSQDDLPVLTNNPHISKIMVFAFNNRPPLIQRTMQWIDDQSISPTWTGLPTDWCYYGQGIRLYPIPNQAYPLILDATIRFPPMTLPTDYSVWTNRAERLIRSEAKYRLFTDLTRDADQADRMSAEIYGDPRYPGKAGALAELRRETMRRAGGPGKLRPSRGWM